MTFTQLSCEEFVEILASKQPVPGGGGAAALVGAIGTALGNMVGSLTVGKKKYAAVEEEIIGLQQQATALQRELLRLVAADAEAFEPLSRAYGIPKDDPSREQVMEQALHQACSPPLAIMRACCRAIELHEAFAAKGSAIAISDVGCGVICCQAALRAASLNVFINTQAMRDRDYAQQLMAEADQLLDEYIPRAEAAFQAVAGRFR
jgi:formiminotetrahydrofolate cyclodeaminase